MIDRTPDDVTATRAEAERFAGLLRTVPPDLPVPHCPGWTVEDVGRHLAGDYVWATRIVTTREAPRSGLRAVRQRGAALVDRFEAAAAAMVDALAVAAADPQAPCPNFAEGDAGRLGWWPRHQLHETTLHRWDVERAAGVAGPLDAARSADGVDELLHVYTRRYRPHRLARPLVLSCTDADGAWRVDPTGARGTVEVSRLGGTTASGGPGSGAAGDVVGTTGGEPGGPVQVSGPASDLLLLLWRRLTLDEVEVRTTAPDVVRDFLRGPVVA